MNLGQRLKRAREDRGLTQEQLADLVPGASQAAISALEVRDSESTLLLFGFSDALQVNPRWLLTGEGDSGLAGNIHERSKFNRRWNDHAPTAQQPQPQDKH